MKYLSRGVWGFLIAALLCAPSSFGQAARVDDSRMIPLSRIRQMSVASSPALSGALLKWASAIERKDRPAAIKQTSRINEIKKSLGAGSLVPIANACIAVGRKATTSGDYQGALMAGLNAVMFAPDYPASHFFLAGALLNKDRKNVKSAAIATIDGIKAMMADRLERARIASVVISVLTPAIALAFIITFMAILASCYKALFTDLSALAPSGPAGAWRDITGLLVILIPLAIGGWLLFILALPLFVWPYMRNSGRFLVALFTAFAISIPSAVEWMAAGVTLQRPGVYQALYMLSRDSWDYETKAILEKQGEQNPTTGLFKFATGRIHEMSNNYNKAIEEYDNAIAVDPNDIRALVNKGNVYFLMKDWASAVKMYKEAIKINPKSVEAHFNLSKVYTEMFLNNDSDQEYQQARSVDPKKTDRFRRMIANNPATRIIDFNVNADDLKKYEANVEGNAQSLAQGWWDASFGIVKRYIYQAAVLAFLVMATLSYLVWSKTMPHQVCFSCGEVFWTPLRSTSTYVKCNQCVAALGANKGAYSAKRDKKRKEIRQYKNRRSSLASSMDWLVPGVGRTLFQNPLAGFALTVGASVLLVYAVWILHTGLIIEGQGLLELARGHILFLGVSALYWISANTALRKDYY